MKKSWGGECGRVAVADEGLDGGLLRGFQKRCFEGTIEVMQVFGEAEQMPLGVEHVGR